MLSISLGEETLGSDQVATIKVPTRGAVTGKLRIELSGTNVFVTVPLCSCEPDIPNGWSPSGPRVAWNNWLYGWETRASDESIGDGEVGH